MPEGDTVARAARRLDAALAGRTLTRFELRVPRYAAADLRGELVEGCAARGKHLLLRIGDWTLHSHLRMEGRWDVYRAGERWHRAGAAARAVLGDDHVTAVGFDLAMVQLVPRSEEMSLVAHLGPDPLADDWDAPEAARRLAADRRPAHVALLDQRNLAGLGNVYAAEVLFVRGLLPSAPIPSEQAAALADTAARMLRAGVDRPRRTFTGEDRPGRRTWVYGRAGRACRRCGTTVVQARIGPDETAERIAFWCPSCQH